MRKLNSLEKCELTPRPNSLFQGLTTFLKPDDWPTHLAPGTLSIQVNDEDFLMAVKDIGANALAMLDKGKFRPALVIPQRKIAASP